MESTLIYALLVGIALVVFAVLLKAALRWAFKIFAALLVIVALAVGAYLWFNRQPQPERTSTPSRRATPAQH